MAEKDALFEKERRFVEAYYGEVAPANATAAAKLAGPQECIFAMTTACVSADFQKPITPC